MNSEARHITNIVTAAILASGIASEAVASGTPTIICAHYEDLEFYEYASFDGPYSLWREYRFGGAEVTLVFQLREHELSVWAEHVASEFDQDQQIRQELRAMLVEDAVVDLRDIEAVMRKHSSDQNTTRSGAFNCLARADFETIQQDFDQQSEAN